MIEKRQTLDELMGDYDKERIAEIERQEAIDKTPAALARKAARDKADRESYIRQGLMTPDGEWIEQPETDDGDDEPEDEIED